MQLAMCGGILVFSWDGKRMSDATVHSESLIGWFAPYSRCGVAFSGGVDSAVVAQAAYLALGDRCVAFTASSPSLARGELEAAIELAGQIGLRHHVVPTNELESAAYRRNDVDRCYHCKSRLYEALQPLAHAMELEVLVNGANADDLGDYRPGLVAAVEFQIRSPLAECRLTKQDVRQLARHWQLPVAEKPAMPCLSSRVAYGQEVTPERLERIDRAEQRLREAGLRNVRVRLHEGELARIEVDADQLIRLLKPEFRANLTEFLRQLGFRYVTVDLEGFRSGSLNRVIPVEQLRLSAGSGDPRTAPLPVRGQETRAQRGDD